MDAGGANKLKTLHRYHAKGELVDWGEGAALSLARPSFGRTTRDDNRNADASKAFYAGLVLS